MVFCLCQSARTFGVDNAIRRQEHICPRSNGASCGLGEGSFPCDETQNSKIVDKISGINTLAGEINAAKSSMSGSYLRSCNSSVGNDRRKDLTNLAGVNLRGNAIRIN